MVDLVTVDGQFQHRDCLFGQQTSIRVLASRGIGGLGIGSLRSSDTPRPQAHGSYISQTFLGGRSIDFDLVIAAASEADLIGALKAFGQAWAPSSGATVEPLVFQLDGAKYVVFGRPDRYEVTRQDLFRHGRAWLSARFVATDPLVYSLTEHSQNVSSGGIAGGLAFPHGVPHGFGTVISTTVTVGNGGNFASCPIITIAGQVTNPRVENVTTSEALTVDLTLGPTDTLTIDMRERTVTLNGAASRTGFVRRPASKWWQLLAGSNQLSFAVAAGSGVMSVAWRDAWIL